ncbi:copper resistance CopC family protein [Microbacterium awajiense]|uniref:copper resistance CopC family protein n=1 Tax=Microbacterium awajiense TaxID=415214 RepID=UPI0031D35C65
MASAVPAAAHDELLGSYPAAGSTIDGSPAEITLTFSGELLTDLQSATIEVIASNGQDVAVDDPSVVDTSITQHLDPDPPDGAFVVRWKVVSSDGHPISGEYTYSVASRDASTDTPTPGRTSDTSSGPSPTPTAYVSNPGHGDPTGGGALIPTLGIVTGAAILGGAVLVVLMVGRERRRRDRSDAAGSVDADVGDESGATDDRS